MATTPSLGLHYPAATDAPDGAGWFYQLAIDIESVTRRDSGWNPYVPTMLNIQFSSTPGCAWRWLGGLILVVNHFRGNVSVGSGAFRISLPRAQEITSGRSMLFAQNAVYTHGGVAYEYSADLYDPTNIYFSALTGSPVSRQPVTSTAPFTPVSGDAFDLAYLYEPASTAP